MHTKITAFIATLIAAALTSCVVVENGGYPAGYQRYSYPGYDNRVYRPWMGGSMIGTGGEYMYSSDYYGGYRDKPQPEVPDSFYTGNSRSPVSFKDNDKHWINSQNPFGYTIQVAEDEKPSQVAGKLQKVPKTDRMAEIRYQKDGKNYYKGIYGTYESKEAAQKALEGLPEDVKQGASVQGWHSVQGNMNQ